MKTMKTYTLGLLLIGSFNVLGELCSVDKGKYEITSSIYLSKNGTCICKAKYEFSPYVPDGKLSSTKEHDNSFADTGVAEKWQCVIPKDNAELSRAIWIIPISALSVVAIGMSSGYSIMKLKNKMSNLSGSTPNTNTVEVSEDGYLVPANRNPNTETIEIPENEYAEVNFTTNNNPMPVTNTDPQVDLENMLIDSNPTEYTDAYSPLGPRPENTSIDLSLTEYTDAYSPLGPRSMDPNMLANQVESVEGRARFEIDVRNGATGMPEENPYSEINEQNIPSNEGATSISEENPYSEINVRPNTTADVRIRGRSPGPEEEFNEILNDVNSNSRTQCNIL